MSARLALPALLVLLLGLTACSTPPANQQPVGATTTSSVRPSSPPSVPPANTQAPAAAANSTCTVPDVVGMVHQKAQDTMQAAGLYLLSEQDATGKGRVLVLDRNWITTAQSVPAGSVVDCTTKILLSAKKIGE